MAMDTANTANVSSGAMGMRTLPKQSIGGLIAISLFWFALNFHWGPILTILIPSQVLVYVSQVAPAGTASAQSSWISVHAALMQGVVEAPGLIVALITNPLVGLLSDRTPGRFGRRRPYIAIGTAVNVVGLAILALAPAALAPLGVRGVAISPSIIALMVGLVVTQLGNNSAAAPFHALIVDRVPPEQRGLASGIMGFSLLLGQAGGFAAPLILRVNSGGTFVEYQAGVLRAYAAIGGVMVFMALLTILTVRERPWIRPMASSKSQDHTARNLTLTIIAALVIVGLYGAIIRAQVGISFDAGSVETLQLIVVVVASIGAARAFGFRPRRDADFSWVLFTRMLVMMGTGIVQFFVLNYMRFVVGLRSGAEAASTLFFLILTVTAVLSTIFAGWGSDRLGRKRMVYLSGGFMALVGTAFVAAPYVIPGHILTVAYVAAAIFGFGYGAYIAVDWALVADVLPSEETFARDMGVWNISLTVPQVFAVIFGGWLIALGSLLVSRTFGYTLLFVAFVVFCVAGTITVRYIKGVR